MLRLVSIVLLLAASALAQITADATGAGAFTGGPTLTWSHVCTSCTSLFVLVVGETGVDNVSGCTYNGTTMTLIAKVLATGNRYQYGFFLGSPATGTHNVVCGVPTGGGGVSESYLGSSASVGASTTAATTGVDRLATSLTTCSNGNWAVYLGTSGNGAAVATTQSTTVRKGNGVFGGSFIADNSGYFILPSTIAESVTSQGGNTNWGVIMACLSPAGAPTTNYEFDTNTSYIGVSGTDRLMNFNGFQSIRNWQQYYNLAFQGVGCTSLNLLYDFGGGAWQRAIGQDGTQIGTYTGSATGTYDTNLIASGLSGTHEYTAQSSLVVNAGVFFQTYAVQCVGGTISATAHPSRAAGKQYGDSIVLGLGIVGSDMRLVDQWISANSVSYGAWGQGNSGATVTNTLYNTTSGLTQGSIAPEYVIWQGGVNDTDPGSGVVLGNCATAGTFVNRYEQMAINTNASASTVLLAQYILPNTGAGASNRNSFNAGISTAVACYNATSPAATAVAYDTTGWINPATDTVDGVHPNAAGYAKIAANRVPILQRYLYGCSVTVGIQANCNSIARLLPVRMWPTPRWPAPGATLPCGSLLIFLGVAVFGRLSRWQSYDS